MNRQILIAIILTIGAGASANLQLTFCLQSNTVVAAPKAPEQQASAITGRVINESGQPMHNAIVYVLPTGKRQPPRSASTDEEGKFHTDDLPRGIYSVRAQVRGYVMAVDVRQPRYFRPGESVTLVVKKGGVITGTVTNSAGEPVIGVSVTAIPHRDPEGRPSLVQGTGLPSYTDDRGVYRLFSLTPGIYLVAASSKSAGMSTMTAFIEDVPTYYPSSTRDTAAEVEVRSGSEATGIDIRYRGERGYAISGSITGGAVTGLKFGVGVMLLRATGGAIESQTYVQPRANESPFAFYGIGEGEYLVVAHRYPAPNEDGARSRPVRVKVKGHDITGLDVSLVSLSSVAGRVVLESATDNSVKCDRKRVPSIDETLFSIRRVQKEDPKEQPIWIPAAATVTAPGDNGEFRFWGLEGGQHQIEPTMLDEGWYVRAISLPRAGRVATSIDVGRNGLAVKAGERVTGVSISLAEGAGSLAGRVVVDKKRGSLPERLRVHLVPAEQDAADDTLRFAEAVVQGDGTFSLSNLAPGRYWLLARQASEEDAGERFPRPLAWNLSSRASLRRDGEASNTVVDLKSCQRVSDYKLPYVPPVETTKEPPRTRHH
jgi:hypothetical protein